MRKLTMLLLLLVGLAAFAQAAETSSRDDIVLQREGWVVGPNRATVLLIETTSTFVDEALNELGVAFDLYSGDDFSALDLGGYEHVFVAMDGGAVELPSVANVAGWAANGGCLHFLGGTAYEPYAIAVNDQLLQNATGDYFWSVSTTPHSTVTDAGHYLAANLPATYDFVETDCAYYQTRSTDGGATVAAVNGDGHDQLLAKPIGDGHFDLCINSPYYFSVAVDYEWGKQVVANMLECDGPVASESSTWGELKSLFR